MPDFSPKYCPECGYKVKEYIDENKNCLNCGFKMDGLVDTSSSWETLIGLGIIAIITIFFLTVVLLLFNFCIICELTELIK